MTPDEDGRFRRSWDDNAGHWTEAVRSGAIRSRISGTDAAIVDAIERLRPAALLDLGCGEGWLVRWLARALSRRAVGIDGSADLIRRAGAAYPGGDYRCIDYDALAAEPALLGGPYDVIAANFALLSENIADLLRSLLRAAPDGTLVIQTVHPCIAVGDGRYEDGWREESFAAFGSGMWTPMPWFFRTLGSWHRILLDAGWHLRSLHEPTDPGNGRPLSLLMISGPSSVSLKRGSAHHFG